MKADIKYPIINGIGIFVYKGKYGTYRDKDVVVVNPDYDYISDYKDGVAYAFKEGRSVCLNRYGQFCILSGKSVITLCKEYDEVSDFHQGMACIRDGQYWGVIGEDGFEIVPPRFEIVINTKSGIVFYASQTENYDNKKDICWGAININGIVKSLDRKLHCPYVDSDGYIVSNSMDFGISRYTKDGILVVYNGDNIIEIPSVYNKARNYCEGLSVVSRSVTGSQNKDSNGNFSLITKLLQGKNRCGAIDCNGDIVIPFEYDSLSDFNNGYAIFHQEGKSGIIDKSNKKLLCIDANISYTKESGTYQIEKDGYYGIFDIDSGIQIMPKYKTSVSINDDKTGASCHVDGIGIISLDIEGHPLVKNGKKTVAISNKYAGGTDFYEGLCIVCSNEKFGVIDIEDNVILPLEYAAISYCGLGVYILKKDIANNDRRHPKVIRQCWLWKNGIKESELEKSYKEIALICDKACVVSTEYNDCLVCIEDLKPISEEYGEIEKIENYLVCSKKYRWNPSGYDLLDINGNILNKDIPSKELVFLNNSYAKYKKEERWGLLKIGGGIIKNPIYQDILDIIMSKDSESHDIFEFSVLLDDQVFKINEDGCVVVAANQNKYVLDPSIVYIESYGLIYSGLNTYLVRNDKGMCGLLQENGDQLLGFEYTKIEKPKSGYIVLHKDFGYVPEKGYLGHRCGVMDEHLSLLGDFIYASISVTEDGIVTASIDYWTCGIINNNGLFVEEKKQAESRIFYYVSSETITHDNGLSITNEEHWGVKCSDGSWKIQPIYNKVEDLGNGIYKLDGSKKVNIENKNVIFDNGKVIELSNSWDEAEDPQKGMIVVSQYGYIGVIDIQENIIVPVRYSYVKFINDKNIEAFYRDGRSQKFDFFGNIVVLKDSLEHIVPSRYDWVDNFDNGYAKVIIGGKDGYINVENQLIHFDKDNDNKAYVVPSEFDYAYDFHHGISVVIKGNLYGIVNTEYEYIIPCQFQKMEYLCHDLYLFQKNGLYGILDSSFKEVVPAEYNDIQVEKSSFGDFIKIQKGNNYSSYCNETAKYGVVNMLGKIIIPAEYNKIEFIPGGLIKLYDSVGVEIYNAKGERIVITNDGFVNYDNRYQAMESLSDNLIKVRKNGLYGCINTKGEVTVPIKYKNIDIIDIDGVTFFKLFTVEKDEYGLGCILADNNLNAVFNRYYLDYLYHGKMIVAITREYNSYSDSQYGDIYNNRFEMLDSGECKFFDKYVAVRKDLDRTVIINANKDVKYDGRFLSIINPISDNLYKVGYEENGHLYLGIMDLDCNFLEPIDYRYGYSIDSFPQIINNKARVEDTDYDLIAGRATPRPEYDEYPSSNGYILIKNKSNLLGMLNAAHQVIIPCRYKKLEFINDGYLLCEYGRLTTLGQFVIEFNNRILVLPSKYAFGTNYNEDGCAISYVVKNEFEKKVGLVNVDGKDVFPPIFESLERLGGNLYKYSFNPEYNSNKEFGLCDSNGKILLPASFGNISICNNGCFLVRSVNFKNFNNVSHYYYGMYSAELKLLLPLSCSLIGVESDNSISFLLNGVWGCIDLLSGEIKMYEAYDYLGAFSQGLARVNVGCSYSLAYLGNNVHDINGGRWGYINKDGVLMIPCLFEGAGIFSEGLAAIKQDGKWGYINTSGEIVINPQYNKASKFTNGQAEVETEDCLVIIDSNGNVISISPLEKEDNDCFMEEDDSRFYASELNYIMGNGGDWIAD